MSKVISVRLPNDLVRKTDRIADEMARPRSYVIQRALECYFDDYVDLQVALDRQSDPSDPIVSGKELRKRLGLVKTTGIPH
jgi:RHH-type transcriptional regulator, rel operon repressor / antitoxin RelB